MRVALIHDHLMQKGGAERVLEVLQSLWPHSPTFTLVYDKSTMDDTFGHRDIRTSFLQKLPFALAKYRWYLPFMPTATESYDLSEFDVVISSSSAFSKGIVTASDAIHLCYCHTPTRYLWSDSVSYVDELAAPKPVKAFLPMILSQLRVWDRLAADRVDHFIANSETVRRRIKKYYGRESDVIHPPVDTTKFHISSAPKTAFLVGGRLVAYKRYDLVVDAFTKLGFPLTVFGSGPAEADLRARAGSNVTFVGRVSDKERVRLFENAIAFIHPHEEDFGITAVESMAAGRPVIAYRKGGAVETVIDGVTGILFDEQSWEELADTVLRFDHTAFNPSAIKAHAEQFSVAQFRKRMHAAVTSAHRAHERKHHTEL